MIFHYKVEVRSNPLFIINLDLDGHEFIRDTISSLIWNFFWRKDPNAKSLGMTPTLTTNYFENQ